MDRKEAMELLKRRAGLRRGMTVYTTLDVSRSGMRRYVTAHVFRGRDGAQHYRITGWVAAAVGLRFDAKTMRIVMNGCGFSAEHEVVADLGAHLFGDGNALRQEGI